MEFELKISESDGDGNYTIEARFNGGTETDVATLPYDPDELIKELRSIEKRHELSLHIRRTERIAGTSSERMLLAFGAALFQFAFPSKIENFFNSARDRAQQVGSPLRVRLIVQDQTLACLPWESLYQVQGDRVLSLRAKSPLVRSLSAVTPFTLSDVSPPVRILVVAPNVVMPPRDENEIDSATEIRKIKERLGRLESERFETYLTLDGTFAEFVMRVNTGEWHVIHFIGHGGYHEKSNEGYLMFAEHGTSEPDPVYARQLKDVLGGHPPLRLVVLNSCEGAKLRLQTPKRTQTGILDRERNELFASVAETLLAADVPAVIAMQYVISDSAAIQFAEHFYAALSSCVPIETCVTSARQVIRQTLNNLEWVTPVLYLRNSDGALFKFV